MAFDKVIIFGPTGNIGSVAARTASKKGAKVYLAMRNTNKDIPGLTKEAEQSGNYERIEADLTNADTVRSAVERSGVQAAFLYLAHGSPDHMLSTFQALKDGGIKHVVFLSSFTVPKDNMEDVPPQDMISYIHTQAELNMRKLFAKEQVVAIRPGAFATNVLHYKLGITERKIKHISPKHVSDMITNEDMGEVSGTILVEGQRGGQDFVYLFGPEMVSEEKAFQTIGKILGEDIEVVKVDADEGTQVLVREGLPEPIAKYLVNMTLKMDASGEEDMALPKGRHAEGKANVEKYTGRPALGFEEWAGRNKEMFA